MQDIFIQKKLTSRSKLGALLGRSSRYCL